ncbi:MAG: hypothetical protein FJ104_11895, partial [Deltaproteobacteria bacterium]|nr:hypothetical protein [Deltaproteobacteria bacterium]
MPSERRLGPGDALAVLALAGTALVIARPILAGGHVTYIDNAVHLAEIHDLAARGATGWSELGFAGFPLGTLHSPLWYGALAALVRLGAPPEPLYRAALLLGYLAPPLALYAVGRVRLGPIAAGVLGWLFLVQPPAIWGIGSPLGGMWTYALATAALVLLFELHSRPALTRRGHLVASVVLAIAALTHLFLLPLVGLLAATALATHQLEGTLTRRELRLRLTGFTLAALASAAYWLTLVLVGNQGAAPTQAFDVRGLAYRLLLPADAMFLLDERLDESVRQ